MSGPDRVTLRGALPWAAGAIVYAGAMAQRMSMGILTPDAQQRFGIGAAEVALLPVAQLLLYLAMQVPGGALVDRLGPRVVLTGSSLVLALGQLVLAVAPSLPYAVLARLLVGLGDASCFVGLLALGRTSFPSRVYPVVAALSATVAAAGQILVTYPLAILVRETGWTPSVLMLSAGSLGCAVVGWLVIPRRPAAHPDTPTYPSPRSLLALVAVPAARRGLVVHYVLMVPFLSLSAMWGYPYLLRGLGWDMEPAALLMLWVALVPAVTGPVTGWVAARWPGSVVPIVVGSAVLLIGVWAAVAGWPGRPPDLLVVVCYLVTGVSVGSAMLAFEIARRGTPPALGGAISGFANIGGFVGAVVAMLAVGRLVDLGGGGAAAYQDAVATYPVLGAFGLVALVALLRGANRSAARG